MVVATIALFAALGGGYATAFSGSGTVQKAGKLGLTATPQDVRTLTGIGAIGANCTTGPDELRVSLRNNSGQGLGLTGTDTTGSVTQFAELASSNTFNQVGEVETTGDSGAPVGLNLHISPVNGTKRPQADVQVTYKHTGNCSTSYVEVLALNTEE